MSLLQQKTNLFCKFHLQYSPKTFANSRDLPCSRSDIELFYFVVIVELFPFFWA